MASAGVLANALRNSAPKGCFAWQRTIYEHGITAVVVLCCVGASCCKAGSPASVVRCNPPLACRTHAVVCKLIRHASKQGICATVSNWQRRVMEHVVYLPRHRVVVCSAYALEATVFAVLSPSTGRTPCWKVHVPRLLHTFLHRPSDTGCIVMTHEGRPMFTWKQQASQLEVAVVIFHVAALLHCLQKHVQFKHGDLHQRNVMVQVAAPASNRGWLVYNIDNTVFYVPNIGVVARIIDFQFSSCDLPNGRRIMRGMSFTDFAEKGEHSCWDPFLSGRWGYDLQTLLMSLLACNRAVPSHLPFLRKALRALTPTRTCAFDSPHRPTGVHVSAVRPRAFLLRMFGGCGPHAAFDFTLPRIEDAVSMVSCDCVDATPATTVEVDSDTLC